MKKLKFWISLILLLTYSIGFAHDLAPHCPEFATEEKHSGSHHHHEHHEHLQDVNPDGQHDHILHEKHFDEDVIDLIVCLLSDLEHPANHCHCTHYIPFKSGNDLVKELPKVKFTATLYSILELPDLGETLSTFGFEVARRYATPQIDKSSKRGPPIISC